MSDWYWGIYKFLHYAPGQERKPYCVECKQASGVVCSLISLALFRQGIKIRQNAVKSSLISLLGLGFVGAAGFSFKLAHNYKLENDSIAKSRKS